MQQCLDVMQVMCETNIYISHHMMSCYHNLMFVGTKLHRGSVFSGNSTKQAHEIRQVQRKKHGLRFPHCSYFLKHVSQKIDKMCSSSGLQTTVDFHISE